MNYLRLQLCQFYRHMMRRSMSKPDKNDLESTATVFSPHQDDATLGCGGTIIKKKWAGAKVKVFFMTDGRKSHAHLISEDELKRIRANEALEAGRMLGLEENDLAFLEYRDGELTQNQDSAIQKVSKILQLQKPDEIFIPHHKEPTLWAKDHVATNRIIMSALQTYQRKATVYEYPIWLWYHQPWITTSRSSTKETLIGLKQDLTSGLIFLKDFRCSVYIGDVLEHKRAALNQYRSQMTRLVPDPRWQTLGDLSNGEFLECFFQEYEIFHRYSLNG
jgi:LmbE family N-acetylglucosaminyl deacetylase